VVPGDAQIVAEASFTAGWTILLLLAALALSSALRRRSFYRLVQLDVQLVSGCRICGTADCTACAAGYAAGCAAGCAAGRAAM
jgi:hypothetical protein